MILVRTVSVAIFVLAQNGLESVIGQGADLKLFLLAFLTIYGGFHLLFFLRIRAAIAMGQGGGAVLVILMAAGFSAPLIIRAAEGVISDSLARVIAVAGYSWMAFLLLFVVVCLFVELYNLGMIIAVNRCNCHISSFVPTAGMRFMIPAALAFILTIYGSFAAGSLRTEFLVIHSGKIPQKIGKIRLLQISDVHLGGAMGERYVSRIIRAVRDANPDIVVSTGDFVDGRGEYANEAARKFNEITPRWGKFSIPGNHELYLGIDKAAKFMDNAGFVFLRNRSATIAGVVDLAGVDDPGGVRKGKGALGDRDILSPANPSHFKILLKHRPEVEKDAVGLFDLQLSGHTHKGQIFPFCIFTKLAFPYHAGAYHLPGGSLLYVNRGAGFWGPPIRLLSPPEITVIDLIAK